LGHSRIGNQFTASVAAVCSIHQLGALLAQLEKQPKLFVIRGAAPDPVEGLHRRDKRTFPPTPRRWVMFDFDKIPMPPLTDLRSEPEAVIEHLVGLLPEQFQGVSCYYQLSASAGVGLGDLADAEGR